ncbi:MAG: histidinol-phosphate transaminase [Methanobacteriaceae archaeon]
MVKVRKIVEELDPYVPGRSQEEIANEFGLRKDEIVKLGSNENPWGPSKKAISLIEQNLGEINRYPETNLKELKNEIANYSNVEIENVIIGGDGADELIEVLCKTFMDHGTEFIVPQPSYTYYEFIFKPYGAIPVYGKWDLDTNKLDLKSVLSKINKNTRMIFLCSPNNPTGCLIDKKDIEAVLKATDALVVIDEAYFEYSEVNNVDLLKKYPNVFIMRTMSKVLGLAGMRVGYGLANKKVIDYMNRVKPVFSLSRTSYLGALGTLRDTQYIEESISKGIESRDFLYNEMSKIQKLNVLKSYANYILVGINETGFTAAELTKRLMENGIIVRDCTSFKYIDEYWIRVSIGTMEENKKFIGILKSILED